MPDKALEGGTRKPDWDLEGYGFEIRWAQKFFLSENCKLNFNKHFKFNNQIEESYGLK